MESVSVGLSFTSQQLMGRKAFERFMDLLLWFFSEKLREKNVNRRYAMARKAPNGFVTVLECVVVLTAMI